jgi:hypothetical protein
MEGAVEGAEAPTGAEAIGALHGELPSGSVGEGDGVDNFGPKIDIPTVVNMKDKKAVTSLVFELIPDVPVWQLEFMLSGMVLHFNGGTGTAWAPLGNAMSKVLQGVQKQGVSAGEKNVQKFVAGMHEASEELAKATCVSS